MKVNLKNPKPPAESNLNNNGLKWWPVHREALIIHQPAAVAVSLKSRHMPLLTDLVCYGKCKIKQNKTTIISAECSTQNIKKAIL